MYRHDLLRRLHREVRPRNYLEIGVNDGRSLALSRVPSIGVDPAFKVTSSLRCDVHLVRETSDDFFARHDPIVHLRSGRNPIRNLRRARSPFAWYGGGTAVDLAFIDGMHLFEYALRDFINVERFSGAGSVIAIDDIFPRSVDEAARERHTSAWAGDVYKLTMVLAEHRPDLALVPLDTTPTGVLLVLGADPGNTVLRDRYGSLVAEWVGPDPQPVPASVIDRRDAIRPDAFLASPILSLIAKGRRGPRGGDRLRAAVRNEVAALRR